MKYVSWSHIPMQYVAMHFKLKGGYQMNRRRTPSPNQRNAVNEM